MRGEGTLCVHSPASAQGRARRVPGFGGGLPSQPYPAPRGAGCCRDPAGSGKGMARSWSFLAGLEEMWVCLRLVDGHNAESIPKGGLEQEHRTTAGCLRGPCPEHGCGIVVTAPRAPVAASL